VVSSLSLRTPRTVARSTHRKKDGQPNMFFPELQGAIFCGHVVTDLAGLTKALGVELTLPAISYTSSTLPLNPTP